MRRHERGTWLCAVAFVLMLPGCSDEIVDVELPKDGAVDTAKEGSQGADAGSSDATTPQDAADATTPDDAAVE